MPDADLLRRTATCMRELAEAATPGPWRDSRDPEPHFGDFGWYVAGCPAGETEDSPQGRADADYIAAWDPTVALAVADWLGLVARLLDMGFDANAETRAALAVAKAFLREATP